MTFTLEEIDEVRGRLRKERKKQGLPEVVTDPAALSPIARAFNRVLSDPPVDLDALGAEVPATAAIERRNRN